MDVVTVMANSKDDSSKATILIEMKKTDEFTGLIKKLRTECKKQMVDVSELATLSSKELQVDLTGFNDDLQSIIQWIQKQ